jgi:hypothetical protein
MDKFIQAYIKTNVRVDAGQRVWCKGSQLEVHTIGGEKKVVLPISKQTFTFDDLKRAGAQVDVVTLKTLAIAGAEGRWKEEIQERAERGLPSNVYIANARSIDYAIEKGKTPPAAKYIGRRRRDMTEVFDTVDEVVDAMAKGDWRKEFARGGRAKRR